MQDQHFTAALLGMLDEAFEHTHGYFLDADTSLLTTLAGVSAEQASIPVGGKCGTLAAQVKHTAFYLQLLERNVRTGVFESADWGEIWRTVNTVTPEAWVALQAELRSAYLAIRQLALDTPAWDNEQQIGGALAALAHSAYHLGEIRQALCVLPR
jgi:hypothetical protein